ncbi:MAG: response regulator transcription factor [Chloroflexi bacterium]|nr:response regulator transcription factor [Chloroflexota bacterium]
MPPIRVLIADDHRLFRRGLRQVCELDGGFEVVGEAEHGQQAVELVRRLQPDVVLMDIEMPILNGVQATNMITTENPTVRVIVLTVYQEDEYVFQAIRAGAQGYLLKDAEEEKLIEAIQAVHRGEALIDSHVAAMVLDEFRRIDQHEPAKVVPKESTSLTRTEMDILCLVAQGADNRMIAEQLSLAEKTVSNRLSDIYHKLHVNNRTQAALYALRQGWVRLSSEDS